MFKNYFTFLLCLVSIFAFSLNVIAEELDFFIEIQKAPSNGLRAEKVEKTVLRSRSVLANPNKIPSAKRQSGDRLPINLFPDCEIEVVLDTLEKRGEEDYTWSGYVGDEGDGGSVTLVFKDDIIVGNIRSEKEGYYQIRMDASGDTVVRQIDDTQFAPCETEPGDAVDAPHAPRTFFQFDAGDSSETFDVMVVYTQAARVAAGGTAAMVSLINLAVSETNTAYTESGINSQVRLVHQQEVTYTEVSSSADLNALKNKTDGIIDTVHTLRNTYGADLVSLFADYSGQTCGRASVMTSLSSGFESSAFSVVSYNCATGYYSFAHEMAHNMGAMHAQPESTQGSGLYSYSMGWRWNGDAQRSIMAYSPGTRVGRFSNPDVLYNGFPTGQALGMSNEANNALSINNAASTVANWRASIGLSTLEPETNLTSYGPQGGAISPESITYTLYNSGDSTINWSSSKTANWVDLSNSDGTLGAGASVDIVVSVNANAQGLSIGTHSSAVTINDITNGIIRTRDVVLTINSPFIESEIFTSADGPLAIASNAVIVSTITIPESKTIVDLNVILDITHTWDSDLDVSLESPAGTVVQLFSNVGGSDDNFSITILDDEAPESIQFGSAPFNGSFQPDGSLADLDGEDASGEWTLYVADLASGDDGTLNSWSLQIESDNHGSVVYIDFDNNSGVENGSIIAPWNTLAEGLADVIEGGVIVFLGDSAESESTEVFTGPNLLDSSITLDAEGGTVQIGVSP